MSENTLDTYPRQLPISRDLYDDGADYEFLEASDFGPYICYCFDNNYNEVA